MTTKPIATGPNIWSAGYLLLRFWNSELVENFDGVLEAIRLKLAAAPGAQLSPSPNPLPQAGEG